MGFRVWVFRALGVYGFRVHDLWGLGYRLSGV